MKFQVQVIALTRDRNLWAVQTNPAHFNHRVAANQGFPDLMIVGPGGVIFRELKTIAGMGPGGGLRHDQMVWRNRLQAAGQDWAIWTPRDLASGRIERELAAIEEQDEYSDRWSLVQLDIAPVTFDVESAPEDTEAVSESVQQTAAIPWLCQLADLVSAVSLTIDQR